MFTKVTTALKKGYYAYRDLCMKIRAKKEKQPKEKKVIQ